MKITEAIEVLEEQVHQCSPITPSVVVKAIRLGIEALKRCRVIEQESILKPFTLLPGETDD